MTSSSRDTSAWSASTFAADLISGYRSTTANSCRTAAVVASEVAACAGIGAAGEYAVRARVTASSTSRS